MRRVPRALIITKLPMSLALIHILGLASKTGATLSGALRPPID